LTHAALRRYLLISLIVHAGVYLAWPDAPVAPALTLPDGAPLQLALQSPSSDVARHADISTPPRIESAQAAGREAAANEAIGNLTPNSSEARRERVPASLLAQGERMRPLPAEAGDGAEIDYASLGPVSPPSSMDPLTLGTADVRARLGEVAETHFYYPPLARRRGWEGEVIVGVRVEGDGRLSAIDVVASSGYRVLDNAAVESLKRMARLSDARGLPKAGIVVRLPVRYRLVDSPA
jgi:periplasmic protein TonB